MRTNISSIRKFYFGKRFCTKCCEATKIFQSVRNDVSHPAVADLGAGRRSFTLLPFCLHDAAPWSVAPINKNNLPALRHPSLRTVLIRTDLFSSPPLLTLPVFTSCYRPHHLHRSSVLEENILLWYFLPETIDSSHFLWPPHKPSFSDTFSAAPKIPMHLNFGSFLDGFSKTVNFKICRTYLHHS